MKRRRRVYYSLQVEEPPLMYFGEETFFVLYATKKQVYKKAERYALKNKGNWTKISIIKCFRINGLRYERETYWLGMGDRKEDE